MTAFHRRRAQVSALAVGCSIVLACSACSGGSSTSQPSAASSGGGTAASNSTAQSLENAYVRVVKNVLPSVVQIRTSKGLGSGVVFDSAGNIVTNYHVVGDATTFQVTLANAAKPVKGTLVGTYPPDDLAVIRVQNGTVQPANFGDSNKLDVGDIVLAMGNPLGLSSSVTNGIVSAVGRTVSEPRTSGSPGATLPNVIQTSAAINPGNSGGALVDLAGQVVGIPTLAAEDPAQGGSGTSPAPGIGFAIPSSIVTDIASQLVKYGKVENSHRAALDVTVTGVVNASGEPAGAGIVSVVSGGPADKAGLSAGEVITAVAGQSVTSPSSLAQVLAGLKPGQRVSVTVQSQGSSPHQVSVTLGQLPG